MMSGKSADLPYGGACLWQLPPDARGAGHARSLLSSTMTVLGFPSEVIDDGTLGISELVTNCHQHAASTPSYEPLTMPELWLWARTHPRPELVVSVFDTRRDVVPRPANGDVLDEQGKGLGIVNAIATTWGWHPSRSRLATQSASGKVTWFTLPLPSAWPGPFQVVSPAVAAQRLLSLLQSRGLAATRRSDTIGISVITTGDLNIWVKPGWFTWKNGRGYERCPLLDLQQAAERVIRQTEEINPSPPSCLQDTREPSPKGSGRPAG